MADRPARLRQNLHQQHGCTQSGGNGEVATVLVNNYYWFALEKEKGKLDSKLHYFTDGDAGGLITVSSAGVIKASKHPKEAQQCARLYGQRRGQRGDHQHHRRIPDAQRHGVGPWS